MVAPFLSLHSWLGRQSLSLLGRSDHEEPCPDLLGESEAHRVGEGTHAAFGDVVRIPHDVTSQAEVTDLDQFALTDEHVPGRQVSVDTLGGDEWERVGAEALGAITEKDPLCQVLWEIMRCCLGVRGHTGERGTRCEGIRCPRPPEGTST